MLPQHIYACNFVVITLVGPTKASIMKLKCTVLNRMWQHDFMLYDEANIFQFDGKINTEQQTLAIRVQLEVRAHARSLEK